MRVFLALFVLTACAAEPVDATTTGVAFVHTTADPPTPTTSTTTDAWSTSTGDPTTGEPATSTGSTGITSTTGTLPDFGEGEGCNKIDVLYLRSPSIRPEHRETIRQGVEYFNQRLVETFAANVDLHVLVTDEMLEWPGQVCKSECADVGTCESSGDPDFPCDQVAYAHKCEKLRGAGHTFPIGPSPHAANRLCGPDKYTRFLTSETPDLLDSLNCATQKRPFPDMLGSLPINSLRLALDGNGPDNCNEGFLRDDAILIIVLISDSAEFVFNDQTPTPSQTAYELFAAKGGNKDALGILAIVNDSMEDDRICQPMTPYKTKTIELVKEHIPHAVLGSECADDTTPYFDATIAMALELCSQYVPQ